MHLIVFESCFLIRCGLRAVLASEQATIEFHEAEDVEHVVSLLTAHREAVLLIDPRNAGTAGISLVRDITTRFLDTAVLIFLDSANEEEAYNYTKLGARGFLLKSAHRDEILKAIREVSKGHRWIRPEIAALYARRLTRKAISAREMEILMELARGIDNSSIAERLQISPNTVKNHMTSLFEKLEAHDRLQALAIAVQRGLLEPRSNPFAPVVDEPEA